MTEDVVVNGKELALLIGTRPSYVTELKKKGRVVPSADGKGYLKAASLALYEQTKDPAYEGVVAHHAQKRGTGAVVQDDAGLEDGDDDDGELAEGLAAAVPATPDSKRKAKALADKAETDARMAYIGLLREEGALLPRAEVESYLAEHATTFRAALERLADTLAPQLAATSDEARCRQLVWDEASHALEELSQGFRTLSAKAAEAGK